MCCCQLSVSITRLLPVLKVPVCVLWPQSRSQILDPKVKPQSQNYEPSFQICSPKFGPMVYDVNMYICVLHFAKSALSCDRLHLSFMFSCIGCQDACFTCRVRTEGKQKTCRPTARKMGPSQRKPKEPFKSVGIPVLFCSTHARLHFDFHRGALQRRVT